MNMAREVVKYSLLFITVLLFGTPVKTHSQNIGTSTNGAENVRLQIESHLEQPGSDTAYHFILEQVRSHCGKNYDCLYRTYHAVMLKLERRFNLSAAIFVAREMARLAQCQGDWESEAHAYKNLSRFHGAMGHRKPRKSTSPLRRNRYPIRRHPHEDGHPGAEPELPENC